MEWTSEKCFKFCQISGIYTQSPYFNWVITYIPFFHNTNNSVCVIQITSDGSDQMLALQISHYPNSKMKWQIKMLPSLTEKSYRFHDLFIYLIFCCIVCTYLDMSSAMLVGTSRINPSSWLFAFFMIRISLLSLAFFMIRISLLLAFFMIRIVFWSTDLLNSWTSGFNSSPFKKKNIYSTFLFFILNYSSESVCTIFLVFWSSFRILIGPQKSFNIPVWIFFGSPTYFILGKKKHFNMKNNTFIAKNEYKIPPVKNESKDIYAAIYIVVNHLFELKKISVLVSKND